MLEWHLIRHGQTEWNTQSRMQGWLDSPLTVEGIEVAKTLSQHVNAYEWQQIYCSPSQRALKTLEIAMENTCALPITYDQRLMEIGLGTWQGLTLSEIEEKDPESYRCYWNDPSAFMPMDGESYFDLKTRVETFVNEVTQNQFEEGVHKRILIMSHGITLMMFQVIFMRKTVDAICTFPLSKNAEVIKYFFDGTHFFKAL